MRISCSTLPEFFECLDVVKNIFEKTIRVQVVRRPIDGKNREASKYEVLCQVSTVVEVSESSEYILEVGLSCGMDYEDAEGEKTGSLAAEKIRKEVRDYAEGRVWRVLPGVIDF